MTSKEKREKIAELREKQQAAAGAKSVGLGAAQECFAAKIQALENGASVHDVEENWQAIRPTHAGGGGVTTPGDESEHDTHSMDDSTLAERLADNADEELVAGGERDEGSEVAASGDGSGGDPAAAGFRTHVADDGTVKRVVNTEFHPADTPKMRQAKENLQNARRHQENTVGGQLGRASEKKYRNQIARLATGDNVDVHGFDEDGAADAADGGESRGWRSDGGSSSGGTTAPQPREAPPRMRAGRDADGPAWLSRTVETRLGRPRLLYTADGDDPIKVYPIGQQTTSDGSDGPDGDGADGDETDGEVELAAGDGAHDAAPYDGMEVVRDADGNYRLTAAGDGAGTEE